MRRVESDSKTPSAPRITIPTVLTSFVGRERELAELPRLLAAARLVTITGPAGCGKTRLALRVAAGVGHHYADGLHWIELAWLTDPDLVPRAVVRAVKLVDQPGHQLVDGLQEALRHKQLLLVLDNCEHLLSACAELVEALLATTAVSVLVTSREPLSVRGELLYPVPPLALPPATCTTDEISQFEATQLFVERARAILSDFTLTPENARVVAGICRRLDGIPLAIELASARVNVLTVEQIAARLDHRFELLPAAPHATYSHHRTLRAAIDWSYDLLSTAEQVTLQRLAVFAGGCSLTTAETICAGVRIEPEQVLELLSSLVNRSLVVADTLRRGEARYALLETIREYAQEKLSASGVWPLVHDRHLWCFLALTEETSPKLTGPYQQLWLTWLDGEYDNLRAALTWSLESGQVEAGLRIAIALYQFWTIRDYVDEGLSWLERLLARSDTSTSAVLRTHALAYAAFLTGFRGNAAAQMAYGREAAALAEAVDDKAALVWVFAAQAHGMRAAGDHHAELMLGEQVIRLFRELGESFFLSVSLSTYSFAAMSLGEFDTARAMLDEGIPLLRALGDPYRIAMALNFAGDLARCEQHYTRARREYEESIALLRELDAPRDLASALHNLGHTYLHLGDVERACTLFIESMAIQQVQRNTPGIAECLIGFATLAITGGQPAAGARLLAAAVAIGGQRIASAWAATRMEYEHYLARARAGLSEAAFQAEQETGSAFSLEQAVAYAQAVALDAVATREPRRQLDELTARERAVAALIAQGKSNADIADELVVSKRTVEKHIANIRSKLGLTERTQIVRWAIATRLVNVTGDNTARG